MIQGGDQGTVDIQHVSPWEGEGEDGVEQQGGVLLAYLYSGHYDAIVHQVITWLIPCTVRYILCI